MRCKWSAAICFKFARRWRASKPRAALVLAIFGGLAQVYGPLGGAWWLWRLTHGGMKDGK